MTGNKVLAQGLADRIGLPEGLFRHDLAGREVFLSRAPLHDHHDAVNALLAHLVDREHGIMNDFNEISGVGHRVVHGGEHFRASVIVDGGIRETLEACKTLAPLHNPPNLTGIDACTTLMDGVPQVAVFDTAFHQTMPDYAYTYAIPYRYYEKDHVRRYGFHGISHRYVAMRSAEILKRPFAELKIITCHLGNGSSLCAVAGGKSMDTSMGFTPLSGLVMGTRSGDIDPALVAFLAESDGIPLPSVMDILNRESGVLGISGLSPDFRDLEAAADIGDNRARLALAVFAYSVARGIGSLIPAIGGIDALVFTAGIGEHSPRMRRRICNFISWLGVSLDDEKNRGGITEGMISQADGPVKVLIVPTDEELMIARETEILLKNY